MKVERGWQSSEQSVCGVHMQAGEAVSSDKVIEGGLETTCRVNIS